MRKLLVLSFWFLLTGCAGGNIIFDLGEITDTHILGDETAPVRIVEYTDFECNYCRDFHNETFKKIKRDYIDTGKVSYQIKDFPLITIHKSSFLAAKATYCAGDQDRYWEMVTALFALNARYDSEKVLAIAGDIGVEDLSLFEACVDSNKYDSVIEANLVEGANGGVKGPPSFFVNEIPVAGAQSYEYFAELIDVEVARY